MQCDAIKHDQSLSGFESRLAHLQETALGKQYNLVLAVGQ